MMFVRTAPKNWERRFAWLPIQLNGLQSIWLEFYEARWSPVAGGFEMRRNERQNPQREFDIATARGVLTAAGVIVDPPGQFDTLYNVQHSKFDTATEAMSEMQVIDYAQRLETRALSRQGSV